MKKHFNLVPFFLTLIFGLFLFGSRPISAEAAQYTRTDANYGMKAGKYYIWGDSATGTIRYAKKKNSTGKVLVKVTSGRSPSSSCFSNGSTVYYCELGSSDTYGNNITYVYRAKIGKKGSTYIGKVKNGYCSTAIYGGSLYLDCHAKNDTTLIHTYRMNLKTGKTKRVVKNFSILYTKKQYFIGSPNSGSFMPHTLSIYNAKTGKVKKISNKAGTYKLSGTTLYYNEFSIKPFTNIYKFTVKKCSLNGKNKKTIAVVNASIVDQMNSKYIYFRCFDDSNVGSVKYYRYTIKTKKTAEVSEKNYKY